MIRYARESEHIDIVKLVSKVFDKTDMSFEFPILLGPDNCENIVVYTNEHDKIVGVLPGLPMPLLNDKKKYSSILIGAVAVLPEYRGNNAVYNMLKFIETKYDVILISGSKSVYKEFGAKPLNVYKKLSIKPQCNTVFHEPFKVSDIEEVLNYPSTSEIKFDVENINILEHLVSRFNNEHVKTRICRKSKETKSLVYIEEDNENNFTVVFFTGEISAVIKLIEQIAKDFQLNQVELILDENIKLKNTESCSNYMDYTYYTKDEIKIPFISIFYQ